MAQWIKTLAAKAYNLGSSPISNMVEGENSLKLSSDFHLSASCVCTHAYIHDTYTDTHDIYTRGERKILFPQPLPQAYTITQLKGLATQGCSWVHHLGYKHTGNALWVVSFWIRRS